MQDKLFFSFYFVFLFCFSLHKKGGRAVNQLTMRYNSVSWLCVMDIRTFLSPSLPARRKRGRTSAAKSGRVNHQSA